MPDQTILLTGGTGFLGGAVLAELVRIPGLRLRALARRPAAAPAGVQPVDGDLARPHTLGGACDGVDVVVHAASYVGADAALAERVNHHGTRALVREAARAGVPRILYLSTASVYGTGPHRGAVEGELTPNPGSPVSASKAAGEAWVLRAGGCVLRPHLVYGRGDRWVVPALAAVLPTLPGWADGGGARASLINVADLARVTAALATGPAPVPGTVYHANHPQPVAMRDIGAALARHLGIRVPDGTVPRAVAVAHLRAAGVSRRHIELLTIDHWYDSARIWAATGQIPSAPFPEDLPRAARWYAEITNVVG